MSGTSFRAKSRNLPGDAAVFGEVLRRCSERHARDFEITRSTSIIRFDTVFRSLGEIYDHCSAHAENPASAEEGARCNTAESEWSVYKPWWQGFRGVAKRHAYRYLGDRMFRCCHRKARQSHQHRKDFHCRSKLALEPTRSTDWDFSYNRMGSESSSERRWECFCEQRMP